MSYIINITWDTTLRLRQDKEREEAERWLVNVVTDPKFLEDEAATVEDVRGGENGVTFNVRLHLRLSTANASQPEGMRLGHEIAKRLADAANFITTYEVYFKPGP